MKIKETVLDTVAGRPDQFPASSLPEVAFIGKSNVGKSSLINALVRRKALARTSAAPGKTRTINFYRIDQTLMLVDLPGYGYAKVSQTEQQRWGKMIEQYLKEREQLKLCVLLIDIRHEPGKGDRMMIDWMRYYGIEPLIVATKLDKIKKNQLPKQLALIARTLEIEDRTRILPVSSENKEGLEKVLEAIEQACLTPDPSDH